MMRRLINHFKWSNWKDVETYKEVHSATTYLVQCKTNANGLKKFKTTKIVVDGGIREMKCVPLSRGALYEELEAKIAEVNEGWVPNWDNSGERKWYPWFNLRNGTITLDDVNYRYRSSCVPPSLIFKSEELCKEFVKENFELYEKLYSKCQI